MKELVFSPAEMVLAKEKIIGAFGLARRAGKCQIGSEICVEQIRKNKAKLVIIADGVSDNTQKKIRSSCEYHNVECIDIGIDKYELGSKLGKKSGITCAAITDEGFVNICRKIHSEVHKQSMEVQQ